MMFPVQSEKIADAFLYACRAELYALKPGNVHVHAGGHHMEVAQFERAAKAAAPHIARKGMRVGHRILGAAEASLAAAGCNANLGIILLCAPLAYAAGEVMSEQSLSGRLGTVLNGLDHADAEHAFKAISDANPGGLGQADEGDVRLPAAMTLRQAMMLAAGRDRISLAYVTNYADVFEFALPLLRQALEVAEFPDLAVTLLHMNLLARFPDSHVARKFGSGKADQVREEAAGLLHSVSLEANDEKKSLLLEFDASLKARGLNPGTTADFVVATLFTERLLFPVVRP